MGKDREPEQHAGSVTSPATPERPEPEKKSGPAKKTKPKIGQFDYIGQDDNRFLFQDRSTLKCYTVDKTRLEYRGEGKFRVEVMEALHS